MTHEVGDILWVVGLEKPGVRVYRVIEEVTKKTLEGTATFYRVQSPNSTKIFSLETLDGKIYRDVESARSAMTEKASLAIDRMIGQNEKLINKFWKKSTDNPKPKKKKQKGKLEQIPNITSSDNIIELPDGTKAKLNLPNIEDIL